MTRVRTIGKCVCCDRTGPIIGRGLIRACYAKRRRNGTLNQFPVDPAAQLRACREAAPKGGRARGQALSLISAGLIEDYAFCRETGETREVAAARVGVSEWTAQRYDRLLREQVSA